MPTIELKNVPQPLYARLEQQAKNHGWTIDHEALNCLANYLNMDEKRAEKTLEQVRRFRGTITNIKLTDDALREALNEGRS